MYSRAKQQEREAAYSGQVVPMLKLGGATSRRTLVFSWRVQGQLCFNTRWFKYDRD